MKRRLCEERFLCDRAGDAGSIRATNLVGERLELRRGTAARGRHDQQRLHLRHPQRPRGEPDSEKLQALALGLDVPEDELFAIARGAGSSQHDPDTSRFSLMYFRYQRLPEEDRQVVDLLLDAVDREIEWRRKRAIEQETLAATVIKMSQTMESPCLCRTRERTERGNSDLYD